MTHKVKTKKKLLYITDQHEYTDHGTIGPLFNGYLKNHCDVYVVYFTKYKNSFQQKGTDYIVPLKHKKNICSYLNDKRVDLSSFDFVFVRNMLDILAHVLKNKKLHHYKVGFRVSFPKSEEAYVCCKTEDSRNIFARISTSYQRYNKKRLRAKCDLFMPTSKDMEDAFYGESSVKSFPLPAGLNPARITAHRESKGSELHFIYVGTLDKLRQFEQILIAFTKVDSDNWYLNISTSNPSYIKEIMQGYEGIRDKVNIIKADDIDALMQQIDECDVGIALLPDLPIYRTSIPAKIIDYYTCALPTLMSENVKNRTLFSEDDALFCVFEVDAIVSKLEEIIHMSQKEIARMGEAGQAKLLKHERNYEIMAKELYAVLESL